SDFFDFSLYIDASSRDIRRWYINRVLKLRNTAFQDPSSYFRKYADLSQTDAIARAEQIWDTINWPSLRQNVPPSRGRASLVLRKGTDHTVNGLRVRKL